MPLLYAFRAIAADADGAAAADAFMRDFRGVHYCCLLLLPPMPMLPMLRYYYAAAPRCFDAAAARVDAAALY